jgi:phage terminase Nu1 subunit (DNA packaging protein)
MSTSPKYAVLADLISESTLAEQLDVGIRTLREWRRRGKGPPVTWVGRRVYFRITSIEEWLRSREKKSPRERAERRHPSREATAA